MVQFFGKLARDESGEAILSYGLVIALVTVAAFIGLDAVGMSFQKLLQAARDAMAAGAA